jgi:hypothetical protein
VTVPTFSILTRTTGRRVELVAALASVAGQTLEPGRSEVVLVNDGGPSVVDVVNEDDSQPFTLRLVEHGTQVGKSTAINSGFEASRGRWICILDDDDLFYPSHLEVLEEAIAAYPDASVIYTDTDIAIARAGEERRIIGNQSWAFDHGELMMMRRAPIACSICIRREAWSAVGGFDDHFSSVLDDWEFYMRLAQQFTFHHVNVTTSQYTQPAGNKAFERFFAFEAGIGRIRTNLAGTSGTLSTESGLNEALDRLRRDYTLGQLEFQIDELRRQADYQQQDTPLTAPKLAVSLNDHGILSIKAFSTTAFEVELTNLGSQAWCSNGGRYPINLSYHWHGQDGAPDVWDGDRTPLPRDVPAGHLLRTRLLVHAPERPGMYRWSPALVQEGAQWVEPDDRRIGESQLLVRIEP